MFSNRINLSSEERREKSREASGINNTHKELDIAKKLENLKLLDNSNIINSSKLYEAFYYSKLKNWKYSNLKDEFRPDYANKSSGGIEFVDKKLTSLLRSIGYDIIKQIGKKIITGNFNLTTVSFPIKIMLPMSILQTIARSIFQFPIYLNLAANQTDLLERFKFVILAILTCFHNSSTQRKPLNPILGETYEMGYEDGSRIYLEQTSHHPPITHFLLYGPNNSFKYYGYSNFTTTAGLNSLKLNNKGKRIFEFKDGTKISVNFCKEKYSHTFFGTPRQESFGEMVFKDLTNGFECIIKLASVKKKPSDYFNGEIKLKNIFVSEVTGSWLSYIEFDNIRYWDIRENLGINFIEIENQLKGSSSLFRLDRVLLEEGNLPAAQAQKEKLEEIQRYDIKLRERYYKYTHK